MTDVSSIRADQLGRLTHAIARVEGAAPHDSIHRAIATAALKVAREGLSHTNANGYGRTAASNLVRGATVTLQALFKQTGFDGLANADLIAALALICDALLTESEIALNAREIATQATIDALDTAVAFYEAQQVNRDIRVSDGADPSKLPDVLAYGEPCDGGRCALSFGEGTREDPDRCVKCGALFLRDADAPFGFAVAA